MRLIAALGLGLSPLVGSVAGGTVPAVAGGGAGMTVFATMEGQDQRLLVGTRHLVTITVVDTPGEADLRDITVELDDLAPHPVPVTCPAGVNGQLALEPEQSLQCTAVVTAEAGYRMLLARAQSRVPGGGHLERSVVLHYTGFLPPPPPPPPAPPAPAVVRPAKPAVPEPAAADPRQAQPVPATSGPAPAPVVARAAPPAPPAAPASSAPTPSAPARAGGCPDGSGSGCGPSAQDSTGPIRKHGGLPFTGMSAPLLAAAATAALALMAGGAYLIRRVA
ncbi:MAG: hypothetical protein ACJ786_05565, partial [Catenulispora sp.]